MCWKLSAIMLSVITIYGLYQILLLTGEMARCGMVYEQDVNKKTFLIFATIITGLLSVISINKCMYGAQGK